MILQLALLVLLLMLSAFFSSSETAVTSISTLKARRLMDEERPRARYLQHWLDDPDTILTTILIGNNLVNIAATTLVSLIAYEFGARMNIETAEVGAIAVVVMTGLVLVFGEVVPKTLARRYAETLALWVCPILYWLSRFLLPLNWALVGISWGVLWLSRAPRQESQVITHAHFRALIDLSEEEGVIPSDVAPMFDGLLELRHTTAEQLMTPRTEMCWVRHDAPLEEVRELAASSGYSRIPVAKESPDDIIGILYIKDLIHLRSVPSIPEPVAADLMRPAVFIPETRNALDVLRILRQKRVHIAIIVDEYGGVSGVLTLEDIIEAIVGSIHDEYDEVFLFDVEAKLASELERGRVPPMLRRAFELHGVTLSDQVTVLSEEQGERWILTDANRNQRYALRQQGDRLYVYDQPTPGLIHLPNGHLLIDARLRLRAVSNELHVDLPGNPNTRISALIAQALDHIPQTGDEVPYGPISFVITHMNGIQVDQVEVKWQQEERDEEPSDPSSSEQE